MRKNHSIPILYDAFLCATLCISITLMSCEKDQTSTTKQNPYTGAFDRAFSQGTVINISAEQLQELLMNDPNVLLIDIRKFEELSGEYPMLQNAMHIENEGIIKHPDSLPKGKSIVLMCRSGRRSAALAKFLTNRGRTVYNLKGGIRQYYHSLSGPVKTEGDEIIETKEDLLNESGC